MSSPPIHEQCLLAFLQGEQPEQTGQYVYPRSGEPSATTTEITRYAQKPTFDTLRFKVKK